jgi:hypothetical protein
MTGSPLRGTWLGLFLSLATASALAAPPAAEVVVRPEPAPGPLDNPLKGWCPYTEPTRQPYSMVFLYFPWKVLEPEENHFAFEKWERQAWSVPEAKGKHLVLRPYIDYPTKPSGLPDWIKSKVKTTPYTDHGGGLSPDYDDPRLLAAMERLIEAMGKRYDKNPRVAFIQLGLLGFWGEWHTWPRDALYAMPDTERRVIDAYRRAFPNKILMARYAKGYAGTQPWLGFHDDLFPQDTDNGHDWSFLAGFRRAGRTLNWQQAAIGGEMVPGQASVWLGKNFDQTVKIVESGHFSWIGPYCPALGRFTSPEFKANSESLVRRMGYQFCLKEIRHTAIVTRGGTLEVTIRGENEGVAPFYYPWPVELVLLDEADTVAARFPLDCDVRTWRPGPFQIGGRFDVNLSAGHYQLALGILDPWTSKPAIYFANKLSASPGWTVLSEVLVRAGR